MELFSIRIQRTFQLVSTVENFAKSLSKYWKQGMEKATASR